jgi:hypothetical protein
MTILGWDFDLEILAVARKGSSPYQVGLVIK